MSSSSLHGILGWKTQNISAYPSIGAGWHFGISISSIHTLMPFRQGAKSWWTGRNPFWAGHNACEMVRNGGEDEFYVERLQIQLLFPIKQTIYFILVQKWGSESQSTQAILKQIGNKSYTTHFCTFLRHPRSYIFELATAVLHKSCLCYQVTQEVLRVWFWCVSQQKSLRPNLSKWCETKTVAVQLMTSREELVP